MRSILLDPREHLAIAFAGCQLLLESLRRDAGKPEPVIIGRVVVFEFTSSAGDFRAAFIEDAREDNVAAQSYARAARWTLCEIRGAA